MKDFIKGFMTALLIVSAVILYLCFKGGRNNSSDRTVDTVFVDRIEYETITDTIKVPQGADWATYGNIKGETKTLPAGRHILKIAVTGNYFNLDWIDFQDPSSVKINPSLELSISKANREFSVLIR